MHTSIDVYIYIYMYIYMYIPVYMCHVKWICTNMHVQTEQHVQRNNTSMAAGIYPREQYEDLYSKFLFTHTVICALTVIYLQ